MTTTANATDAPTFTDLAVFHHATATRRVARLREAYVDAPAGYAAQWTMRDLVNAEMQAALYDEATKDQGEMRFVTRVARAVSDGQRSTDAFDRARGEAEREAALEALKNLRSGLSTAAKLALVDAL